jgi:hydroxymethylpyrimidine pyrophosphatase-like HAD family hydrolase
VRCVLYFLALAADYDGTIAHDGFVGAETCDALRRLKDTTRRLILVTGRQVPDLKRLFPEIAIFDRVVAENGALIYDPSAQQERLIAPPPSTVLVRRLREMKVEPISVGRAIVSTWEPHQATVLNVIREFGLELQIVFNKGAVMILPPGVNKATGLLAALSDLDVSAHNVVAVGDAENDHAFLSACGCAAAVANALPAVKAEADIELVGNHGAGVVELIEQLIHEDTNIAQKARHGIRVGVDRTGNDVYLEPYRGSVLIAGPAGSGKSALATALTERMAEKRFQFCVIDPEGDYVDLQHTIGIGSVKKPPSVTEALNLLRKVAVNVVINTQALTMGERRELFSGLVLQTCQLRARTGRPHWLVIDEAHQVLPVVHEGSSHISNGDIPTAIFVTVLPHVLTVGALTTVDVVLVCGDAPKESLAAFGESIGMKVPTSLPMLAAGEILYWAPSSERPPMPIKFDPPLQSHKRHGGKYAVGDVGPDRSFYFRGPHKTLNMSANNLYKFVDIAFGIDDETWEHHLYAGDYSAWFRHVIKDENLACEAAKVEADRTLDPHESRGLIKKAVWRRYAAPCGAC